MRISALIPAYNCASTIRATLDSVLRQTLPAYEILVMNDGSTDDTAAILETYGRRITVYSQPNRGVAAVRNELLRKAKGDLVAFIDSDDIWHPKYLEVQSHIVECNPEASAYFMGHADFCGSDDYLWKPDALKEPLGLEKIPAIDFFKRYNQATGPFSCLSYCCVPLKTFQNLGSEPFKHSGTEDSYCLSLMALLGKPFILASPILVAYRVHASSLTQDHTKSTRVWIETFELLENLFDGAQPAFQNAFRAAYAAKCRTYAKFLFGVSRFGEARRQLWNAARLDRSSLPKSIGWIALSYLPSSLHPSWPSSQRQPGAKPWKWWRWKANRA